MDGLLEQRTPLVTHGPESGPTVPVPVPLPVRLPVPVPAKPPDAGGRWRRGRREAPALTGFGMVFLTSMVASYVLQRDRPPSGSLPSGQWAQPAPATPERTMLAGMG